MHCAIMASTRRAMIGRCRTVRSWRRVSRRRIGVGVGDSQVSTRRVLIGPLIVGRRWRGATVVRPCGTLKARRLARGGWILVLLRGR